jgi:Na+:H+ antiporter, NhaA family
MRRLLAAKALLKKFLALQAASGLVLMAAAALALIVANSPLSSAYFETLHAYVGPLSIHYWINDALMALFFLVVGLEIKREFIEGELSTWKARILPGVCAAGGMAAPAFVYLMFNGGDPLTQHGWAIPAATDIAFALGVLSLLGSRVPLSLKVFLTALAIIDDLGAVIIIALFYTSDLSLLHLAIAGGVLIGLIVLNVTGVRSLWPYLAAGLVLWWAVFQSGVHATLAGVLLAMTIPLQAKSFDEHGPLKSLEHALHGPTAFVIVPIFGFANAGVSLAGVTGEVLLESVPLGVAAGLFAGKLLGVFGAGALLKLLRISSLPQGATWLQLFGVSMLCGIGFTMSLFIGMLAFDDPHLQDRAKLGVIMGSALAGIGGYLLLRLAPRGSGAAET